MIDWSSAWDRQPIWLRFGYVAAFLIVAIVLLLLPLFSGDISICRCFQ